MQKNVFDNAQELGVAAAAYCAKVLNDAIRTNGSARIVLSTGASQFEFFEAFIKEEIDWSKVEMFHLDEYVNLSSEHPASFRLYLQERFLDQVPIQKVHLVDGEGDEAEVAAKIAAMAAEVQKAPIDLALIGIGENAHVAFNDPPADFDTKEAYLVVNLDDQCKKQQVGEGWFATIEDVPKQAITMSVHQIMASKCIVSCVPHKVKAQAIRNTLVSDVTPLIPATILKSHSNWHLYLDRASASAAVEEGLI